MTGASSGSGAAWNIPPGEGLDRAVLHARFGGNPRTRIAPSAATPNVFVFIDALDEATGFWRGDVLHVPGERWRRETMSNANRALADHRDSDRTLRVFMRCGQAIVYVGAFEADLSQPFYFTEPDGGEGVRNHRIVFRLVPAGTFADPRPEPPETTQEPSESAESQRPWFPAGQAFAQGRCSRSVPTPWPAVVLASCLAIAVTTWGWTSAPVRPAVTTWFLLLCPGMALVRLLPDRGLLLRLVLAVAASLALETLVATFMLEAKAWAPSATLGILLLITVGATALDLRERPLPRWAKG